MSSRVRVAVLAGGRSSEHDISVASARSVVAALDPRDYETVVVEIDRAGRWELASGRSELPVATVETLQNGKASRLGPGSIIFHSSNDLHNIRNVGSTPATYHVVQWRVPAAAK